MHFYRSQFLDLIHKLNLKMDILKGIQYSIQAWDEVKAKTICNCWYHTKILLINKSIEGNIKNLENIQENDLPIFVNFKMN